MRTSTVAEAPSAPPGGRTSRHEARPADPLGFSAHLDRSTARTATAEGHKTERHTRGRDERPEHDGDPVDPKGATVEAPAEGSTEAATTPVATPAPEATPAHEPTLVLSSADLPISQDPAPVDGAPVATVATPVLPTVPGATAPESVPTPDPALTGAVGGTAPTEQAAVEGTGTEGVPTAGTGAPVPAEADAGDLPAALAANPGPTDSAAEEPTHPAASQPQQSQPADGPEPVSAPAPTAPTAAAPVLAPAAPAATSEAPVGLPAAWAERGLAQSVDRMIDLVHVATARGVARAKLQLHPQELGGIEVRLRQSADGLVAIITAQNRDAVQAVAQAGAELRRSLEDRGLQLASLDIRLATDGDNGQAPWQQHAQAQTHAQQQRAGVSRVLAGELADTDPDLVTDPTPTTTTPAGALVDVVA